MITVPANTLKEKPVTVEALVAPGVVTHVEVEMARGCHRMVHCAIYEGAFQVWPRNPEGTMATDSFVIRFDEYCELKRGHNLLTIKCWSPGTTYPHDVTVRFVVTPKHLASMIPVIELLTRLLQRMGVFR